MADLTVHHYSWVLEASEPIVIPHANTGNNLRGAFGMTLKQLVCVDFDGCRRRCAHAETCPYAQLFETAPPQDSAKLSRYQDIPRPFVLKPSPELRRVYAAGERLDFGLVLVGDKKQYLPYVAVTFKELETRGLGISRGRFTLKNITALDQAGRPQGQVYDWQTAVFRGHSQAIQLSDFQPPSEVSEIEVEFLTPVYLKAEGRIVQASDFQFQHLAKRLRDRISSLAYFYGGGELDIDYRRFGLQAEHVQCVARHLVWADARRRSWRTGLWHDLGGLVGAARFRGDLTPFWSFLKMGELVHCGKYATFGQGEFRIRV